MQLDLSDITVVLDRSGSMMSMQKDAESGLNSFIKTQAEQPGRAVFSLVQFDSVYEFVHKAVPIKDVPHCKLEPRGSTALLDAVGRSINEAGARLSAMNEADRPGLVMFLIITDGQENSSKEFTKAKVKETIEHQKTVYNWVFTFIGANQDAFQEAASIGISTEHAMNFCGAQAEKTFGIASRYAGSERASRSSGGIVQPEKYTDEERAIAAGSK